MSDTLTAAIGTLVRRHRAALVRLATSLGLRHDEAVDVVQDGFLSFVERPEWRALATRPVDAERLLAALVRNAARNRRRRPFRGHEPLEACGSLAEGQPLPDAVLLAAEEHQRLSGCVATLKEMQRAVVVARLFEGTSGLEVASRLSMRPEHVATVLLRARRQLEVCLAAGASRSVA
ncbi:MAG: sigma-70 family RNA polymerase sigma factor [Myxococcaceae bacterium]